MKLLDLLTMIFLAIGLVLAIATYVLTKRNILVPMMYPRVFGIGALIFAFVSMMTSSILLRSSSEFLKYTLENTFWSGLLGIVSYISGRILERRQQNK